MCIASITMLQLVAVGAAFAGPNHPIHWHRSYGVAALIAVFFAAVYCRKPTVGG